MLLFLFSLIALQQSTAQDYDWDKEFGVEERTRDPASGEFPVEAYVEDDANAGAKPFENAKLAEYFGGQDGIRKIAERTVELSVNDPRIAAIFVSRDTVRLKRTLFEQFCYLLNAGCNYTGRDMASAHADMGVKMADLNALVEHLQRAMHENDVPFTAQNRLLAKLAPMSKDVVAH